jgi:NAD(P)-dependent dehydrogenase (short-subunit alcohol dehydrogenase family)
MTDETRDSATFDLSSRTVIVTGGASGIGATIAEGLLAAGARVSVWGRDAARLDAFCTRLAGVYATEPLGCVVDVTDAAGIDAGLATVVTSWGSVDGLVNAAGTMKVGESLEFDEADFRGIVDVHLMGAFLCSQRVAGVMREAGGGSILNLGSMATFVGQPRRAAYSAAKSAVGGLTRTLAVEWGPYGIRVNAIAPGYIATGMAMENVRKGLLPLDKVLSRTPLRRLGEADELVPAALYLLSDVSSFVTGTTIPIDGGWLANGYVE